MTIFIMRQCIEIALPLPRIPEWMPCRGGTLVHVHINLNGRTRTTSRGEVSEGGLQVKRVPALSFFSRKAQTNEDHIFKSETAFAEGL